MHSLKHLCLIVTFLLTSGFVSSGKESWTKEIRDNMSPHEVLQALFEGNKRFNQQDRIEWNFNKQQEQTKEGQWPAAIILGCIDSRAPAELIFDTGIGFIFNGRIAGNFADIDMVGSLEFACKVTGAKAIVVMGHSNCGAIKSACDGVELGNITHMLSHITPAVDHVKGFEGNRTSKNPEFVLAVTKKNVELTIENIRSISPILKEMESQGQIIIAGAFYDVETGSISFYLPEKNNSSIAQTLDFFDSTSGWNS